MQGDHVETTVHVIGNGQFGIEPGLPRLRHNRIVNAAFNRLPVCGAKQSVKDHLLTRLELSIDQAVVP